MKFQTLVLGAFLLTTTAITIYTLTKPSKNSTNIKNFLNFKKKYSKLHTTPSELEYRYKIYKSNLSFITLTNSLNLPYKLGENQFSDLTFQEFQKAYLFPTIKNPLNPGNPPNFKSEINWKKNLTPIKDQKMCGSCWAFSTTGAVEALISIKTGKPAVSLSEQELVDCSTSYGNHGCRGGLPSNSFEYIKYNKIGLEEDYPYSGIPDSCWIYYQKNRFEIKGWKKLEKNDVESLADNLINQPVSVAIEVERSFQMYRSGVYVGSPDCGKALNHAVLVVGLREEGEGVWDFVVKNSWGVGWGEEGFVRMRSGQGSGNCGIANGLDAMPIV